MESTIWLADGFVVITGDIGSGKTTLIESFLAELPNDIVLAHISQTQLSPVEFLQALLVEFGFKPFRKRKVELLSMLKDFMVEQYAAGKKILLVIDEAQNLSRKVLEEVRLLSGLELQKEKLLRIIIAGQPELSRKLDSARLQQLTQRVRLALPLGRALQARDPRIHHAPPRRRRRERAKDLRARALATSSSATPAASHGSSTSSATLRCCARSPKSARSSTRRWSKPPSRSSSGSSTRSGYARTSAASTPRASSRTATGRWLASRCCTAISSSASTACGPGKTIIGRTADNDLQIQSRFISRHHAQVVSDQTHSVLEDLNSTNGVFIRSQRVKHQELVDGDIIQIGEHKLLYRDMRGARGARR